jgi:autotransporter adhesin
LVISSVTVAGDFPTQTANMRSGSLFMKHYTSYAGSVAIGAGAQANADPTTAVGNNAIANGNNSVALGANTTANGSNSVALGQGSVANRDNSVSVGNAAAGLTRQITNVAPGTQGTDAVNLDQLNAANANMLNEADSRANRGIASAVALAGAVPSFGASGNSMTAGVGSYGGQSAVALQYAHRFNYGEAHPLVASIGAATSTGGSTAIHGSLSVGW